VSGEFDVAEAARRLGARRGRIEAAGGEVAGAHVEVKRELVVDIGSQAAAAAGEGGEEPAYAGREGHVGAARVIGCGQASSSTLNSAVV
jgi:hypothetical protein